MNAARDVMITLRVERQTRARAGDPQKHFEAVGVNLR
jgi:hypothetical protein